VLIKWDFNSVVPVSIPVSGSKTDAATITVEGDVIQGGDVTIPHVDLVDGSWDTDDYSLRGSTFDVPICETLTVGTTSAVFGPDVVTIGTYAGVTSFPRAGSGVSGIGALIAALLFIPEEEEDE
jgi:hypothetical protein